MSCVYVVGSECGINIFYCQDLSSVIINGQLYVMSFKMCVHAVIASVGHCCK